MHAFQARKAQLHSLLAWSGNSMRSTISHKWRRRALKSIQKSKVSITFCTDLSEAHGTLGAFQRIGGLEIASSPSGIAQLYHRQMLAQKDHLPAKILTSEEAARIAPDFHAEDTTSKALFFPSDGTAEPVRIVDYYKTEAKARGVLMLDTKASSIHIEKSSTSSIYHISTTMGSISTKTLVLATGIWTPGLIQDLDIDLSIVPVLHPYAHGPDRPIRDLKQPFVRWPEKYIYARDHGDHDGFGSYAHVPLPRTPSKSALENETIDGYALELFDLTR
jgi:glycine/D-amino acid oxidase-like deaminating enzyme